MNCPCGTSETYASCCEPYLEGKALPDSAEKLMRSRYTAFAKNEIEYVKKTLAPESRKGFDVQETKRSAKEVKWKRLEILRTEQGGPQEDEGIVEFKAIYELKGENIEHHEVSTFRKDEEGRWLFVDGDAHTHKEGEGHHHHHEPIETVVRESPKVGRNDPCSCGSGKKYKKCCAA